MSPLNRSFTWKPALYVEPSRNIKNINNKNKWLYIVHWQLFVPYAPPPPKNFLTWIPLVYGSPMYSPCIWDPLNLGPAVSGTTCIRDPVSVPGNPYFCACDPLSLSLGPHNLCLGPTPLYKYLGGEQEWSVKDFRLRSSQLTDLSIFPLQHEE